MDWAPSDLVAAFLLAGALQTARRRAAVLATLGMDQDGDGAAAAVGVGDAAGAAAPACPRATRLPAAGRARSVSMRVAVPRQTCLEVCPPCGTGCPGPSCAGGAARAAGR